MPKTALVTTTIHVPEAIGLLAQFAPDVPIFIVGDQKSPHDEIVELTSQFSQVTYLRPELQARWKCSEPIGWNCIQRRSIGFLEALAGGAEMIISWDTDNLPLNADYFHDFQNILSQPFNGLRGDTASTWFDPGWLLGPISHRGFPHQMRAPVMIETAIDAKVGVAAGLVLGNPDVDAYTRLTHDMQVHTCSALADAGVVVDPAETHTVFNSQNTAFLRRFAPTMFMAPGLGRYDDIYASLLTQRALADAGYHVKFGRPLVWQQRHAHDLIRDLEDELFGMKHLLEVAEFIDNMPECPSALGTARHFYENCNILNEGTNLAGIAWCDDIGDLL